MTTEQFFQAEMFSENRNLIPIPRGFNLYIRPFSTQMIVRKGWNILLVDRVLGQLIHKTIQCRYEWLWLRVYYVLNNSQIRKCDIHWLCIPSPSTLINRVRLFFSSKILCDCLTNCGFCLFVFLLFRLSAPAHTEKMEEHVWTILVTYYVRS